MMLHLVIRGDIAQDVKSKHSLQNTSRVVIILLRAFRKLDRSSELEEGTALVIKSHGRDNQEKEL